jgi:hypothetical protein
MVILQCGVDRMSTNTLDARRVGFPEPSRSADPTGWRGGGREGQGKVRETP